MEPTVWITLLTSFNVLTMMKFPLSVGSTAILSVSQDSMIKSGLSFVNSQSHSRHHKEPKALEETHLLRRSGIGSDTSFFDMIRSVDGVKMETYRRAGATPMVAHTLWCLALKSVLSHSDRRVPVRSCVVSDTCWRGHSSFQGSSHSIIFCRVALSKFFQLSQCCMRVLVPVESICTHGSLLGSWKSSAEFKDWSQVLFSDPEFSPVPCGSQRFLPQARPGGQGGTDRKETFVPCPSPAP